MSSIDTHKPDEPIEPDADLIAVVGMAAHLPGAADPDTFWRNIRDGIESIRSYTEAELLDAGVSPSELALPSYVRHGAPLDRFDHFDAEFFGFGPKDAAIMDPQHRNLLEVAWEALESAGHPPENFDGDIGVFAGCGMNAYMMFNLLTNPDLVDQVGLFLLRHTGNDKDFLATRISYCLNLTGPSVNVQTACSTSLVAIHQASQSLLSGECDMALAGGVTIELPHRRGYLYNEGEILSPDGHCRAFDQRAAGTVFGSGAGMVVLRRLGEAEADGDIIHAVIRGSAVNNDGASKVGYLAPSVDGQAACVAEALAVSGIDPATIGYVEAHGTGTPMGDPIEVAALNAAFGRGAGAGSIALGSVKTNIGHLDTAAGVAGFIKVVKALEHRQIPPTLHFTAPNVSIDFAGGPFYVNTDLRAWPPGPEPRRAAMSSLGVGGTNAHIVVEEYEDRRVSGPSRRGQLLLISGRNADAVEENTDRIAEHLQHTEVDLADVAYSLHRGRRAFGVRRSVVVGNVDDAIDTLVGRDAVRMPTRRAIDGAQPVFVFPGGGSQYPDMGRDLYANEMVYRDAIDRGITLCDQAHGVDLRPLLFTEPGGLDEAVEALRRPSLQLPAIFVVEYALAQLWMSWGVRPAAMAGHSMGENTAACIAGVLSFEDALGLVVLRGRLFEEVPSGGMLSVAASAEDIADDLAPMLSLACHNAPQLCVVSGPSAELAAYGLRLQERGIESRPVAIDIAAHSAMLDPVLDRFRSYLRSIELHPPKIPIASNLTGTWLTDDQATDPEYWCSHLRGCVRFQADLDLLLENETSVVLEVGPGRALTSLARQHPALRAGQPAFASLRHPDEGVADDLFLLEVLGRLWTAGVEVDADLLYAGQNRSRVELPTYAFQRQRYFVEAGRTAVSEQRDNLERSDDILDWFHQIDWREGPAPSPTVIEPQRWLVFVDREGVGAGVIERLRRSRHSIVTVQMGDAFVRRSADQFVLAPEGGREGYDRLVEALIEDQFVPDRVLHFWSVTSNRLGRDPATLHALQEGGFYSLLYLAQAIGDRISDPHQHWTVVGNGMLPVAGTPVLYPEKAMVLGPASVIPAEFPGIGVTTIDLDLPELEPDRGLQRLGDLAARFGSGGNDEPLAQVLPMLHRDLLGANSGDVVGYRRGKRFRRGFERIRPVADAHGGVLREGGTYLITGGMGGIGLTLAEHLAREWRANLVLVSRTELPAREDWQAWLDAHGPDDRISKRLRRLQAIECTGAQLLVMRADVTSLVDMSAARDAATGRFGRVDGVIHAAGVLDQDLIQLKSDDGIDRVLTPKVQGALILDRVFAEAPLDFMVLMSSTSSVLGAAGQIDYAAANIFLDAFAAHRTQVTGQRTLALGWAAWNEVGMAAESVTEEPVRDYVQATHPLLDYCAAEPTGDAVATFELAVDSWWLLDEHRVGGGRAVLPATGHLELMAAAYGTLGGDSVFELRNVAFHTALSVPEGVVRDGRAVIERHDGGWGITVESAAHGSSTGWRPHSVASVVELPAAVADALDLDAIRARCEREESDVNGIVTGQERHLRFGPRWRCLHAIHWGDGEALAELRLPADFGRDLDAGLLLHPALLDMATGFGLPLVAGYDDRSAPLYVPLSYERIVVHRPLPANVFSHVRVRSEAGANVARFDVSVTDAEGFVVIDIENFAVIRVEDPLAFGNNEAYRSRTEDIGRSPSEQAFRQLLDLGVRPDEGWNAFERALSADVGSHVFLSPMRLEGMIELVEGARKTQAGDRFERPSLESLYRPPTNDVERSLVELWGELLGVAEIGVGDDFFALGGHSLIALRMFNRLKATFGADYPMSVLFDAPTIAQLAALIIRENDDALVRPAGSGSSVVSVGTRTNGPQFHHLVHMAGPEHSDRLPFFLVAGMYGNVLNLRHLALLVGRDRPFYGIQALGLREDEMPLETFEEMAKLYIEELRQVQPVGPYLIGGFSGGGITAWEIARQLRGAGEDMAMLVMLDTPVAERGELTIEDKLLLHAQRLRNNGVTYMGKVLRERIEWERAKRGKLPEPLEPHERRSAAIEAAFYRALATYETHALSGDVHLYRPELTTTYRLSRGRYVNADREFQYEDNGWGPFVHGTLHVNVVPGDHDSMVLEPNVRVLASRILADLEAIEGEL